MEFGKKKPTEGSTARLPLWLPMRPKRNRYARRGARLLAWLLAACQGEVPAPIPTDNQAKSTSLPKSPTATLTKISIPKTAYYPTYTPYPTFTRLPMYTISPVPSITPTPYPLERLVYVAESGLAIAGSDGSNLGNLQYVAESEYLKNYAGIHITVSPNGHYLAFNGTVTDTPCLPKENGHGCPGGGAFDIILADFIQQTAKPLAEGTETNPSWGPDSKQVIISKGVQVTNAEGENIAVSNLFVFNVETGKSRRITQSPTMDIYPSWSPDGEWVAFVRYTPNEQSRVPGLNECCNQSSLYLARPDGSALRLLKDSIFHGGSTYGIPAWSPDSQQLAVLVKEEDRIDIALVNVQNGESQVLGLSVADYADPVWSPDGNFLAIAHNVGDDGALLLIDVKSGEQKVLLYGQGKKYRQLWSPSGKLISFTLSDHGRFAIFVTNRDGTYLKLIQENFLLDSYRPVWLPALPP